MRGKIISWVLLLPAIVFCLYFTPSASAASAEEEVLKVLEDGFKALNTSNGALLSSLWSHSNKVSMFGPDKSSPFLTQGWEEIDKGIKAMTNTPAGTYNFSVHNPQVTILGDNAAITTAYVTLVYTDPTTKAQTISQARQTLVYQKTDGKWLIVHNHTSEFPVK
jgi:uncharacterized protein (TIGR02246 family)